MSCRVRHRHSRPPPNTATASVRWLNPVVFQEPEPPNKTITPKQTITMVQKKTTVEPALEDPLHPSEFTPPSSSSCSSTTMGDHCTNNPPLGRRKHDDVGGALC